MHSGIAGIEVDPMDITKRAAMNDHIVKRFRKSGIPMPPLTLRDTRAGTWMKWYSGDGTSATGKVILPRVPFKGGRV